MPKRDSWVVAALFISTVALGCGDDPTSNDATSTTSGSTSGSGGGGGSGGSGPAAMSFFVSSAGVSGTGNLGGITGADQHCLDLATAAGSTKTAWVAYLSAANAGAPIHARDRIGSGPWYNAKGEVFAASLQALHPTVDPTQDRDGYIAVKPADALFMDENGNVVDSSQHDILTGSQVDGTLAQDGTCADWTSEADDASARVGHSDTPEDPQYSPSWNSAHDSAGCSTTGLVERGGNGRIYCFATD
jgi:hypothetical protein